MSLIISWLAVTADVVQRVKRHKKGRIDGAQPDFCPKRLKTGLFRGARAAELPGHVPGGLLGALALGCVHLAKVPFYTKEDVSAQNQTVGIFLIVGGDRVVAATGLVQDVVCLEAERKGADVLGDLRIPLPLRLVEAVLVASVEMIAHIGGQFKLVRGSVAALRLTELWVVFMLSEGASE